MGWAQGEEQGELALCQSCSRGSVMTTCGQWQAGKAGPGVPALGLNQQAEYDAMLLEHAGEAIPALAAAAGGDTFAPFFAGFLPLLLSKTVSVLSRLSRASVSQSQADLHSPPHRRPLPLRNRIAR